MRAKFVEVWYWDTAPLDISFEGVCGAQAVEVNDLCTVYRVDSERVSEFIKRVSECEHVQKVSIVKCEYCEEKDADVVKNNPSIPMTKEFLCKECYEDLGVDC